MLEEGKMTKGGLNREPSGERPPAPPAQGFPEMQAPNLEMMEGAKNALMSFLMYYYQALRQDGKGVEESKRIVADEIMSLYDRYAQNARIEYRPDRMIDPKRLLDEIISDVKGLGVQGKGIERKLLDFKRLIKE
jgi:hypothetical protein